MLVLFKKTKCFWRWIYCSQSIICNIFLIMDLLMRKFLVAIVLIASFYIFVSCSAFDAGFESDGYSRSLRHGDEYKATVLTSIDNVPVIAVIHPDKQCKYHGTLKKMSSYPVDGEMVEFYSACLKRHERYIAPMESIEIASIYNNFATNDRVTYVIDGEYVTFSSKNLAAAVEYGMSR